MGRYVLLQNVKGWNDLVQNIRERNVQVQKGSGKTSWARNVQVQKVRGRNFMVRNFMGQNVQIQNVRGRNVLVEKFSGGQTSRSKKSGSETSCPKGQRAKRPGPIRLSPKRPGAKTIPLWLWHSLILLYDCEVLLLLLSFKFDLRLVNWFDLIRGNMILLIKNFHLEMLF